MKGLPHWGHKHLMEFGDLWVGPWRDAGGTEFTVFGYRALLGAAYPIEIWLILAQASKVRIRSFNSSISFA